MSSQKRNENFSSVDWNDIEKTSTLLTPEGIRKRSVAKLIELGEKYPIGAERMEYLRSLAPEAIQTILLSKESKEEAVDLIKTAVEYVERGISFLIDSEDELDNDVLFGYVLCDVTNMVSFLLTTIAAEMLKELTNRGVKSKEKPRAVYLPILGEA
jgi:hypothetical protein